MVFISGDRYSRDGLPTSGYGFNFGNVSNKEDEDYSNDETKVRLGDVTVKLVPKSNKGSSSATLQVTHRFMATEYCESRGVHIVEGQTYEGDAAGSDDKLLAKIGAALFHTNAMNESLQLAADCLTQEVYDAMEALFKPNGSPKGPFQQKVTRKSFRGILYIGGVFCKSSRRGEGLGSELVRALTHILMASRQHDFCCCCAPRRILTRGRPRRGTTPLTASRPCLNGRWDFSAAVVAIDARDRANSCFWNPAVTTWRRLASRRKRSKSVELCVITCDEQVDGSATLFFQERNDEI